MKENYTGILLVAFLSCLIIFGLIGFFNGFEFGNRERESYLLDEQLAKYTDEAELICNGVSETNIAECLKKLSAEFVENQLSERNLTIQRELSAWAKWLLGTAILSTTISLWALILIKMTLTQGADINRQSVRAADAANAANELIRGEQRPWVTLRWQLKCEFEELMRGKQAKIKWLFDYENMGKLPAFHIRHEWVIMRLDTGIIGRGNHGINFVINEAKRKYCQPSNTQILFSGEKTNHLWGSEGHLSITGDSRGDLHLCSCLIYSLDPNKQEIGIEANIYGFEKIDHDPDGMTHLIRRYANYMKIEKWIPENRVGTS